MNWFKKNDNHSKKKDKPPVDRPVRWPNGWAVETPSGIWYVNNGVRIRVFSQRCLQSWSVPVRNGTDEALALIPIQAGLLGFRSGSLIRDFSDGKIYLVSGSRKNHIVNPDILDVLDHPVLDVSRVEANLHLDGEEINDLE
jgi:hypothetical protein